MSAYINNLIRQGEHQQLDFKHSITDSKKIARSFCICKYRWGEVANRGKRQWINCWSAK